MFVANTLIPRRIQVRRAQIHETDERNVSRTIINGIAMHGDSVTVLIIRDEWTINLPQ